MDGRRNKADNPLRVLILLFFLRGIFPHKFLFLGLSTRLIWCINSDAVMMNCITVSPQN